jgi:hypothetical protein
MTDIYIAYSRQDRDRLRIVGDLLAQEGWEIWMDPAEPKPDLSPIADLKLGWSKAILVLWSDSARRSEYVRSEAATGLYKNKLVQARIDGDPPPRPFDELEAVDLSLWHGEIEDPNWRRLVAMLRNCAGEPGRAVASAQKRPAAPPPSPPQRRPEAAAPQARPVEPVRFVEPPPQQPQPRPVQPAQFIDAPPPPRPAEPARFVEPPPQSRPVQPAQFIDAPPPPRPAEPPRFVEPPPAPRFAEPPPPPRFAEPPPPPRYAEPPPPPRYAEPPPPPPRYAEPPPPPRYAEPAPRYAETDTTRYVDPSERSRGPRLAESVYRVPTDRREERVDEPELLGGRRSSFETGYNTQRRSFAAAPIVAAFVLIGSGVGLWVGDPFGWRAGGGDAAPTDDYAGIPTRMVAEATTANATPATAAFEDSDESGEDWRRTDRKSAEALRDHVSAYPRASTAETARSSLRVMDAQAWVKAVTADSEAAYRSYLKAFPAEGDVPGAMATAANDRLTSLVAERSQAIEEIQRGLAALDLYDGSPTGQMDEDTTLAMRRFGSSSGNAAPVQASATPRDLRAFAEAVRSSGAQPKASAAVVAAVEADKQRVAQAQAASMAAARAAETVPEAGADSLALAQQGRMAEVDAWAIAERAGTLAAYQSFLATYPASPRATDARAAITKLNRPAPFSVDQLMGETRTAVEGARRAQAVASQRAMAARTAAQAADNVADAQTIVGADGDRYRAQISGGAPNGLGVRTRGGGPNAGDRYRGEMRNGQASGVGVYEFADNPGNAAARAARYEGEHSGDVASGHGVFQWKGGDSFAGQSAGAAGQSRGVLTYGNGQRYEGELAGGDPQGHGALWAADGGLIQAGRWAKGELVAPATR